MEEDLTKFELSRIIKKNDIVIHLAAITDAAGSFRNPVEVQDNNYIGTLKVSEACHKVGAKLIFASSTSVYGTQQEIVSENCSVDQLKPQSPYASTKIKEEELIQKLSKTNGLESVILRFGTIYGVSPGIRFHTAVNKFCWQAAMGFPLTVWNTAYDQKRPYLSLADALNAVGLIIKKEEYSGEIFNVVSKNLTVREVIETIREIKNDCQIRFVDSQIMNQLSYDVSIQKISKLGYQPTVKLKENIKLTLQLLDNFYKNNIDNE